MKISIIVPIYGVEKYIERCARSLFCQTYNNIEFVFVDDCTKDCSIEILKKIIEDYPKRKDLVKIISHKFNRGLAAARDTGVKECSGDYFLHVDSDDWLELNAVETLVSFLRGNDADIISFGYISEYEDKSIKSLFINERNSYINDILKNKVHASIWSKMYKTSFYKNSGFETIEGLNQGEDYVLVPRLLHKADKVIFVGEHLYHYEMANYGSYTKNVKNSAIKNIFDADNILYAYFSTVSDCDTYSEALEVLYVRSMLYLIKTSDFSNYKDIRTVYSQISYDSFYLSKSDLLILWLVNHGFYRLTFYIINLANKIL